MNHKILFILSLILLTLISEKTLAEYDSNKLGEAIGAYIGAAGILDRWQKTECSSYLKESEKRAVNALKESLKLLNNPDAEELGKIFFARTKNGYSVRELETELVFKKRLLPSFQGMKEELGTEFACGWFLGNAQGIFELSKSLLGFFLDSTVSNLLQYLLDPVRLNCHLFLHLDSPRSSATK